MVQHRSEPLLCCAQVCLLRCTLLSSLLLLLICSIHETEQNSYCQQIITEKHLAELEELVSALLGPAAGQRLAWGRLGANQPPRALWQLHEQSDSTQEPVVIQHEWELGVLHRHALSERGCRKVPVGETIGNVSWKGATGTSICHREHEAGDSGEVAEGTGTVVFSGLQRLRRG